MYSRVILISSGYRSLEGALCCSMSTFDMLNQFLMCGVIPCFILFINLLRADVFTNKWTSFFGGKFLSIIFKADAFCNTCVRDQ